jgi:hypothetical protein
MREAGCAFEKSEALARNSNTDLYELRQWPVPRFVNIPISIFRALISNFSGLFCRA